jgi:hypothetical protein
MINHLYGIVAMINHLYSVLVAEVFFYIAPAAGTMIKRLNSQLEKHTLNDVGTNIKAESLLGFVDKFVAIFKNSAAARRAFHKLVPGTKTSYSRTRWGGFRDIAILRTKWCTASGLPSWPL